MFSRTIDIGYHICKCVSKLNKIYTKCNVFKSTYLCSLNVSKTITQNIHKYISSILLLGLSLNPGI